MRQPDIHRVEKAQKHLHNAGLVLRSIKWENCSMIEDDLLLKAKDAIIRTNDYLSDIINIQNTEDDER